MVVYKGMSGMVLVDHVATEEIGALTYYTPIKLRSKYVSLILEDRIHKTAKIVNGTNKGWKRDGAAAWGRTKSIEAECARDAHNSSERARPTGHGGAVGRAINLFIDKQSVLIFHHPEASKNDRTLHFLTLLGGGVAATGRAPSSAPRDDAGASAQATLSCMDRTDKTRNPAFHVKSILTPSIFAAAAAAHPSRGSHAVDARTIHRNF
ncbi:hypothetical protein ACJJTC_004434 [Scirpophaga incertulas]